MKTKLPMPEFFGLHQLAPAMSPVTEAKSWPGQSIKEMPGRMAHSAGFIGLLHIETAEGRLHQVLHVTHRNASFGIACMECEGFRTLCQGIPTRFSAKKPFHSRISFCELLQLQHHRLRT